MPLVQGQVVTAHGWLSMSEFTDLITISQMTPGPIAVNSATFVGIKIAGIPGALIATLGCILPSCGRSYESGNIIPWRMISHSRQRASLFPVH